MLIVENNTTFVEWGLADDVNPLAYGGELVIVFDPGKTNMAMIVGTPTGTVLNHLEFSGNNRGNGTPMDTTLYCRQVQEFLRKYLTNARLYCVAVEQTILKKGTSAGYHSNQVLNEIRANLLQFFFTEYGIRVEEINNWSWKHAMLPEGYRSQSFKGSKKWILDKNPTSPYAFYFNADMTDCLFIYMYVCTHLCKNYMMICNRRESAVAPYHYSIVPKTFNLGDKITNVTYNNTFDLWSNMAFYVNRIMHTFAMLVPVDKLELSNIYGKAQLFEKSNMWDKEVYLVVARE